MTTLNLELDFDNHNTDEDSWITETSELDAFDGFMESYNDDKNSQVFD